MVASLMRHQVELPVERIVTTMIKTENIRAYLENGGNPNLTCDGQSWIDNAIVMERREIVKLLKEFGAVPSPDIKSTSETIKDIQKLLGQFPDDSEEPIDSNLSIP